MKKKAQNKEKSPLFPKIFRFITERWKIILASMASGVIIAGIIFQNISLYYNLQEESKIKTKRGSVERELSFWKKQSEKYKDSRDIYFRIAALEYELGNKNKAKEYLQKSLEIDPSFREGLNMEKQIGK